VLPDPFKVPEVVEQWPYALPRHDSRHGTPNGYGNLGCRCDDCCDAISAYQVPQARKRRADGIPPGDHRHGTDNGYTNYGCRCDPCCEARSRKVKRTPQADTSDTTTAQAPALVN
jgi:hypothetical protein